MKRFVLLVAFAMALSGSAQAAWVNASSRMWTGVKVYYQAAATKKMVFVGRILGGNWAGDMVLVEMKSGTAEWKKRGTVREWFVWDKDPAIKAEEWNIYEDE
jgi:hypothetical protein